MRKSFYIVIILAVIICIFFLGILGLTAYSIFVPFKYEGEYRGLQWVRDESCFVDYSISEDTIQLRYSMCFYNTSGHDLVIYSAGAQFDERTLDGLMENVGILDCNDGNSCFLALIPDGEMTNVIVVFEGKYLGGKIRENPAIPKELILAYGLAEALPTDDAGTEESPLR